MSTVLPRRELTRVDTGADYDLPPSLLERVEAAGGLWYAGDAYTTAVEVITAARRVGAVALRLDFRDLSLLESLPETRYLHLRSDGRPPLDPVAHLRHLQALMLDTGAHRGRLDPLGFPELRWLRLGLGGKGGAAMLTAIERGHRHLEWLAFTEVKARTATELCAGFPRLRVLRIHFADYLRELGRLAEATPHLEKLSLDLTGIRSLAGLEDLTQLETLFVHGGRVTDLEPLGRLPRLRYAQLELSRLTSIEPLRGHPSLRMLFFNLPEGPDLSVLDSIPGLVAVRSTRPFDHRGRWSDLHAIGRDHPLRLEWSRFMRE
jgi:hypothetical protein